MKFWKLLFTFLTLTSSNVYQLTDISKIEFDERCVQIDKNYHEDYFENYPNEIFKVTLEYPAEQYDTLKIERYKYIEELLNQDFGIQGTPNNNLRTIPIEMVYICIQHHKETANRYHKATNSKKVIKTVELSRSQKMQHIKIISPNDFNIIRKKNK